jgi:hypothetical protein
MLCTELFPSDRASVPLVSFRDWFIPLYLLQRVFFFFSFIAAFRQSFFSHISFHSVLLSTYYFLLPYFSFDMSSPYDCIFISIYHLVTGFSSKFCFQSMPFWFSFLQTYFLSQLFACYFLILKVNSFRFMCVVQEFIRFISFFFVFLPILLTPRVQIGARNNLVFDLLLIIQQCNERYFVTW